MSRRALAADAIALAAAGLLAAGAGSGLTGCAPVVVAAGVGAGVMVATDRRTTGAQLDDETIELKIATRVRQALERRASQRDELQRHRAPHRRSAVDDGAG